MMIFGPAFRRGGPWAAIVGVACALNAFVGLGETILMVERPRMNLINSSLAMAAVIGCNLVLIPRFGALGAAIGMLVPYTLQGVLRAVEISWVFDWRWPWRARPVGQRPRRPGSHGMWRPRELSPAWAECSHA